MQILVLLYIVLLPHLGGAGKATPQPPQDYCKLYGTVYLERDPLYRSTASHMVYLQEEEAFADMVVFRESNKLFADEAAVWYITQSRAFADHVLYVTTQRHQADFTVHFTDARAFATCRD